MDHAGRLIVAACLSAFATGCAAQAFSTSESAQSDGNVAADSTPAPVASSAPDAGDAGTDAQPAFACPSWAMDPFSGDCSLQQPPAGACSWIPSSLCDGSTNQYENDPENDLHDIQTDIVDAGATPGSYAWPTCSDFPVATCTGGGSPADLAWATSHGQTAALPSPVCWSLAAHGVDLSAAQVCQDLCNQENPSIKSVLRPVDVPTYAPLTCYQVSGYEQCISSLETAVPAISDWATVIMSVPGARALTENMAAGGRQPSLQTAIENDCANFYGLPTSILL